MSQVPVLFFQVCATAIPTLLVAVAIGAKFGDLIADAMAGEKAVSKASLVGIAIVIPLLVAIAESACLLSVAAGRGPFWVAGMSLSIVNLLVLVLGLELAVPVLDKLEVDWMRRAGLLTVIGGWFIMSVVSAVVLQVAVGT